MLPNGCSYPINARNWQVANHCRIRLNWVCKQLLVQWLSPDNKVNYYLHAKSSHNKITFQVFDFTQSGQQSDYCAQFFSFASLTRNKNLEGIIVRVTYHCSVFFWNDINSQKYFSMLDLHLLNTSLAHRDLRKHKYAFVMRDFG